MATGNYGIKRPADVSPSDVEVFLHYSSNRDSNTTPVFKKLNSSDILSPVFHNTETGGGNVYGSDWWFIRLNFG